MGVIFSVKCASNARLDGKTAVITGCNTGIGKATVKDFFKRGARVVMACRNLDKAEEAAREIRTSCENVPNSNLGQIVITQLDLMSLQSVRSCAAKILEKEARIDLLINNAGIMACPYGKTEDGFEMQLGTNHFGHFLFTLLLLPKIVKSAPARIVNVASLFHKLDKMHFDDLNYAINPYNAMKAYGQSKLAVILFSKELATKLKDAGIKGVTTYSVHPGVINTDLTRHLDDTYFKGLNFFATPLYKLFCKTPELGAQTTIHCSVDEDAGKQTGLYYAECQLENPSSEANKDEDAKRLWDVSLKLVGLDENYNLFGI